MTPAVTAGEAPIPWSAQPFRHLACYWCRFFDFGYFFRPTVAFTQAGRLLPKIGATAAQTDGRDHIQPSSGTATAKGT